jgi:FKBP-type peptidyl-prolyl cis-trans isomerase FklB
MLVIFAAQIILMKKYLVVAISFLLIGFADAQKPASKTVPSKKTTTASAPVLKTENDSLSYAIGLSVVNFYRQQGIKLNTTLVTKACNDILEKKKPLLTDDQANLIFMCHSNPQLCAHVKEDEKFLAENKKKPNVKTTPSGLQYEVITQGTGARPNATDSVTVNYKGTLTNGTEFDNSYKRGQPVTFALDHVIRGWTEGLQLMSVGSKYKFYIPYQLGYGLNEMQAIPAGSTLVFEVELLDVKKPK